MIMIDNEPDPLRRIPIKRPAEIHADVGSILREERLRRGHSLEAVAQQSRIPKRYLEALENDRLDEFPAFVYMRGFLKAYCEHLELPFEQMWSKIVTPVADPAPVATTSPSVAVVASQPTHSPAATRTARAADHAAHHAPSPRAAAEPTEPASATGAILFALALFIGLAVWMLNDRRPPAPTHDPENTPRALRPLPRSVETKITLHAIEDAWVRVLVDDVVVFEGRIPRGATMDWKPVRGVSLYTTSPTSLQMTMNGSPLALSQASPHGEYRLDVQ